MVRLTDRLDMILDVYTVDAKQHYYNNNNDLINTQHDLHCEFLLMSVPRGGGGAGLGGIPMEGMFV